MNRPKKVHRRVKQKSTSVLCTGDLHTVLFTQEEQQQEQKTAHSGLATTGKSWNGQDSNQSPSRINQYRQHLWYFFEYLLAHFANFFLFFFTHLMRSHRCAPSGEGWQTCRLLQDRRKTCSCGLEVKSWTGFSSGNTRSPKCRWKSACKAGLKSDGE